jgi:hypothetical protein
MGEQIYSKGVAEGSRVGSACIDPKKYGLTLIVNDADLT